jgi:hypothetical protein
LSNASCLGGNDTRPMRSFMPYTLICSRKRKGTTQSDQLNHQCTRILLAN